MRGLTSLLGSALRTVAVSQKIAPKVMRFGFVGAMSGLVFAAVTAISTGLLAIDPKVASTLGYAASIPLNFAANRRFTFRSGNGLQSEVWRFIVLHACNIMLTMFAMAAVVDGLKLHYAFGIILSIFVVPCVNFVAMNWWVFGQAIHRRSEEPRVAKDAS